MAWERKSSVSLEDSQNAFVESFNGKFRDECLNEHWFTTLPAAGAIVEAWRLDYNSVRPHSALRYLTPQQYVQETHRSIPVRLS